MRLTVILVCAVLTGAAGAAGFLWLTHDEPVGGITKPTPEQFRNLVSAKPKFQLTNDGDRPNGPKTPTSKEREYADVRACRYGGTRLRPSNGTRDYLFACDVKLNGDKEYAATCFVLIVNLSHRAYTWRDVKFPYPEPKGCRGDA